MPDDPKPSIEDTMAEAFDKIQAEQPDPEPDQVEAAEAEAEEQPDKDAKSADDGLIEKPEEPTADDQPEAPEAAASDTESDDHVQSVNAPDTWSDDAKAEFARLDPAMQSMIAQQIEGERTRYEETETRLKEFDPISRALEPVRQQLELSGIDSGTYVSQLVAADRFLRQDPRAAFEWLAKSYGYELPTAQPEPAEDEFVDPQTATLARRLDETDARINQFLTAQQQQQSQTLQQQIDAFAADPAHPHFEAVKVEMGALMQAGRAKTLEDAYGQAVWANPETRAKLQADMSSQQEEKRKQEAKAKADKARNADAANLSTRGTSPGANSIKGATLEDTIRNVANQVYAAE